MFFTLQSRLATGLILLAAIAAPAQALDFLGLLKASAKNQQAKPNQFGATVRNPGSVMPEWWNEENYVPETIDGAQRLRIGSAGSNGRYAVVGRSTCDLVLLYHAKSGQQISQPELEECALLEYHLVSGITGEKINLADVFAKQETVARFSAVLLERMAKLKDIDLFYSRAVGLKLKPYDLAANGIALSANLTGNLTNRFSYTIGGKGFPQSDSWFSTNLGGFSAADARSIESARAGYRIDESQNLFAYRVIGTRQTGQRRVVDIEIVKFRFQYIDENNNIHSVGI
jgi:hypothetical protein